MIRQAKTRLGIRWRRMKGVCRDTWLDDTYVRTCIRRAAHNLVDNKHSDGEKTWGEEDHV